LYVILAAKPSMSGTSERAPMKVPISPVARITAALRISSASQRQLARNISTVCVTVASA
jgi:citrate lyase gamma subunit